MLSGTEKLDAIIADATKDPYNELTRFVFMAASSDEEVIYSGKGGYAHLPTDSVDRTRLEQEGEPITEDSIFELYSCTKLPTTIAALQLVEQGRLGLDDEVSRYVPECADVKVFCGWSENGAPQLEAPKTPVTIRMLLTHTSGSIYAMIDPEMLKVAKHLGLPGDFYVEGATKEAFTKLPLINIDWLSLVVEAVSGLDLETYFQRNLFEPLGIRDTSFKPDSKKILMAYADEKNPSGPLRLGIHPPTSGDAKFGGAGLLGSPRSFLRLLRAILRGGELDGQRILKQATVDSMFEEQLWTEGQKSSAPAFTQIGHPVPARTEETIKGMSFGFGGALNPTQGTTGRPAGTLVWRGMANTPWFIDRTSDVAVVVFSNVLPRNEPHFHQAWNDAETELYRVLKQQQQNYQRKQ
ncbi:hypothetical protein JCM8202v2_002164 [Rhodotorula sphaerocarpa]